MQESRHETSTPWNGMEIYIVVLNLQRNCEDSYHDLDRRILRRLFKVSFNILGCLCGAIVAVNAGANLR